MSSVDRRMDDVDYEGLDRLLGALSQSVANRIQPTGALMAVTSFDGAVAPTVDVIPQALVAAGREPAPVSVEALPRGVSVPVVLRGVLQHFLPMTAAMLVPLSWLLNIVWFDNTNGVRVLEIMFSSTVGYALGLLALGRWVYPHSHPDGQRSDAAGLASSILAGLYVFVAGPTFGLEKAWIGALFSGLTVALLAFAPWLRRTSHIAPASVSGGFAKLHAAVRMGALGAVLFGSLSTVGIGGSIRYLHPTMVFWQSPIVSKLVHHGTYGFLMGAAFAVALGVVYRRHALADLKAWKIGLWGAAAASLPWLAFTLMIAVQGLRLPPLGLFLVAQFTGRLLPGFLMGYVMVKLAQQSGRER